MGQGRGRVCLVGGGEGGVCLVGAGKGRREVCLVGAGKEEGLFSWGRGRGGSV